MVRYFMTIPEAAQLVLQAGASAANGRVYVLDMGAPVRIVELAHDLILLAGLDPERDIKIEFTGLRPGEKMFEELLTAEEGTDATSHEKILIARKPVGSVDLRPQLSELYRAAEAGNSVAIKALLCDMVPTYRPLVAAGVPAHPAGATPAVSPRIERRAPGRRPVEHAHAASSL
jgi:FlaA1/EpsC-like NDP-sugar epimerase